jgi:hypothetical protein
MTNSAVAAAWREGYSANAAQLRTDGRNLWSYRHLIGKTEDGYKVAICCHYSQTTAHHCAAAKQQATAVTECAEHYRERCRVYQATLVRPLTVEVA